MSDGTEMNANEAQKRMDLIRLSREASGVRRSHTIAHHGEYTVGKHSHDALSILFALYPGTPSVALIRAIHMHDYGERFAGDLPAPAKWSSPNLRHHYLVLEDQVLRRRFGWDIHLTEDETRWLGAVDLLEFIYWCQDQVSLGNQQVRQAMEAALDFINEHRHQYPNICVWAAYRYNAERTSEKIFP